MSHVDWAMEYMYDYSHPDVGKFPYVGNRNLDFWWASRAVAINSFTNNIWVAWEWDRLSVAYRYIPMFV